MSTALVGREQVCNALTRHVDAWRGGKGALVMIAAEPGRGKSAVLTWLEETFRESATVVRVDCRPPIGSLNTTAIRPLQPFGLAIDRLFVQSSQQARKRLALNVGMSLLSSLPIAGDLFYAAKAISQDVREYKRETAVLQEKKANAVQECADTLRSIAEKSPFILL
ncbi:MAG: ATPase domain, partial [Bacteroidota bacterium]